MAASASTAAEARIARTTTLFQNMLVIDFDIYLQSEPAKIDDSLQFCSHKSWQSMIRFSHNSSHNRDCVESLPRQDFRSDLGSLAVNWRKNFFSSHWNGKDQPVIDVPCLLFVYCFTRNATDCSINQI